MYVLPDTQTIMKGYVAKLHSPLIVSTSPKSCLVFWFAMVASFPVGRLRVLTSFPDLSNQNTVWHVDGGFVDVSVENHWQRAAVTIDTSSATRVSVGLVWIQVVRLLVVVNFFLAVVWLHLLFFVFVFA